MRTIALETASQIALRNYSEEVEGGKSVYLWLWWRRIHAIKHRFLQKLAASHVKFAASHVIFATSHEKQVSPLMILVLFYIWEDARIWAPKIFWKYLSEGPFCQFSQSTECLIPDNPPWNPFRVCWRSVTAVASDFILVVPDGEWRFLFETRHPNCHTIVWVKNTLSSSYMKGYFKFLVLVYFYLQVLWRLKLILLDMVKPLLCWRPNPTNYRQYLITPWW